MNPTWDNRSKTVQSRVEKANREVDRHEAYPYHWPVRFAANQNTDRHRDDQSTMDRSCNQWCSRNGPRKPHRAYTCWPIASSGTPSRGPEWHRLHVAATEPDRACGGALMRERSVIRDGLDREFFPFCKRPRTYSIGGNHLEKAARNLAVSDLSEYGWPFAGNSPQNRTLRITYYKFANRSRATRG